MQKSLVPWRTPEQFRKVYEYVYSEDITKKRWAVEQMAVWETRCWPALPCAVEATLLLIRSKIQDMLFEADKSFCQAREVEMMYCTSVVRFANLIIENDQNTKGRIRMADLAEKKNIPAWIIDIRHNITHGHCPTLPVLRMAYKTIMEYLEVIFWAPESSHISFMKKTFNDKPMTELLYEYRSVQYEKGLNRFIRNKAYHKALKNVCRKIEQVISKPDTRRNFLQILVHPNNFVRKEDIELAVKDDKEFINDVGIKSSTLPNALRNFWNPLLEILHKYNSIQIFVEMLLLSQKNRTIKIFQRVVDCTVLYILDLTEPPVETSDIRLLLFQKALVIDYYRLLYSCMIGCSTYSNLIFEKLSEKLNLGNWKEELSAMLSIKRGLAVTKDTENAKKSNKGQKRKFDITFTVGDLEEDIHSELRNRNPKFNGNHWSYAPIDIDFSKVPHGNVFNPVEKERKEKPKQEMENQLNENEQVHPIVTEISKPIEMPKPMNFIFERTPAHSSMIYRRREKK